MVIRAKKPRRRRKREIDQTDAQLKVEYVCPNVDKNKIVTVDICEDDLHASESECEICGSHGSIIVFVNKCPRCKIEHKITLSSW